MKRTVVLAFVLVGFLVSVHAQEQDDLFGGLHRKGSQMISLSTGGGIPLFILPTDASATEPYPLGVGASFSLSYDYFLANRFALGGSLTGAFNTTVGGRTLFLAPLALRLGYWWGRSPVEFRAGTDLGFCIMRLSGNGVITPFAKAGAGAFVQVSEAWSVGGQTYWWFIPELHTGSYASLNRFANILEISIGALYHF
ncbi:MAG TPA: hypothetical protein VIO60_05640 [Rectinemataceae bacterium]